MKITVGVITAPRKCGYYLDQTLKSLDRAGFNDVTVFAEPGSVIPESFKGHVVRRPKTYGDWTNWATALYELLLSNPETDYFYMAEDDGIVCKGIIPYLERTLPMLGRFGTASIYCPGKYHIHNFIGYHDECHGALTWSTLTVIMPRDSVTSFFSEPFVQRHRFENVFESDIAWGVEVDPCNSVKDAILGKWAQKNKLPMYYHTPCLASHIGIKSTLSSKQTSWENLAIDFVGEDYEPKWEKIRIKSNTRVLI
jgi:hypothetical protein